MLVFLSRFYLSYALVPLYFMQIQNWATSIVQGLVSELWANWGRIVLIAKFLLPCHTLPQPSSESGWYNITILLCNCWVGFMKPLWKFAIFRKIPWGPAVFTHKSLNSQLKFPPWTLWLFAEVCHSEQNHFCLWGISALKKLLVRLQSEEPPEVFGRGDSGREPRSLFILASCSLTFPTHQGPTPLANVRSVGPKHLTPPLPIALPPNHPPILPHSKNSSQHYLQSARERPSSTQTQRSTLCLLWL